jgi:cytosine/adenosine deaminase-related metal-dependent hydrolase
MPTSELVFKARYVFPVDGPVIHDGSVHVQGQRIVRVGPSVGPPTVDLGAAAIVPGFVNAHTHFDLSGLRAKQLGGRSFVDWLRAVIAARREMDAKAVHHAVGRGIDASLAAGTTLVGDISSGGMSWTPLARSPLRATVFCELLGLGSDRAVHTAKAARSWLSAMAVAADAAQPPTAASDALVFDDGTPLESLPDLSGTTLSQRLVPALSPHAPYSTHPLLYDLAGRWGTGAGATLCSHLAETREELRLIRDRAGPLRAFLESIGAWNEAWRPPGPSPLDYLRRSDTERANWLIAHGNYLTDDDIVATGRLQSAVGGEPPAVGERQPAMSDRPLRRLAVAYCPRTHFYFAHAPHPYPKLLASGVAVCIGTDSLASTPTLSVLDELRFLRRRDPNLPGATLLHMATLAGAWALGRERDCGSLSPGKFADLAVIRLPADRDETDPHELLLQSNQPVTGAMIGGQWVFRLR